MKDKTGLKHVEKFRLKVESMKQSTANTSVIDSKFDSALNEYYVKVTSHYKT